MWCYDDVLIESKGLGTGDRGSAKSPSTRVLTSLSLRHPIQPSTYTRPIRHARSKAVNRHIDMDFRCSSLAPKMTRCVASVPHVSPPSSMVYAFVTTAAPLTSQETATCDRSSTCFSSRFYGSRSSWLTSPVKCYPHMHSGTTGTKDYLYPQRSTMLCFNPSDATMESGLRELGCVAGFNRSCMCACGREMYICLASHSTISRESTHNAPLKRTV